MNRKSRIDKILFAIYDTSEDMTVEIEIDEKLLAQVDDVTKNLRIDRDKYFQKLVEEDLISRQYAQAYEKNPIEPDEFEIEEEQLIEVWKDL